jgi:hypothetical protein
MGLPVELYRNNKKRIESQVSFPCDQCAKEVVIYPPEAENEKAIIRDYRLFI